MDNNAILIDPADNVAVVVIDIRGKQAVTGIGFKEVIAGEDIPRHHKIAIKQISENSPVIKYGNEIGLAGTSIESGDWVHAHNIKSGEGD